MATFDRTVGGTAGYPAVKKGGTYRLTATVDFNEDNYSAADILQLINVPANTRVTSVAWIVETVEGATLTFDIGDGDDPNGYIDGANGNALSGGDSDLLVLTTDATPVRVGYSGSGEYYTAADTIDLIPVNDADAAKITVIAFLRDGSANE